MTSSSIWTAVKFGLFTGVVFGAGYWYSKLSTKNSPTDSQKILSEDEELAKNQETYENLKKQLKLGYYKELTSKPRNTAVDTQGAPPHKNAPIVSTLEQGSNATDEVDTTLPDPKPPKVDEPKQSSDRLATALSKVLGQATPGAVSNTANEPLPAGTGSAYAVQVASLLDRKVAEELANRLILKGYEARLVQADLPDRGVVYRVRIHGFANQDAADDVRVALSVKEGIEAITIAQ